MCGRYVSPSERAIEAYWHIGADNSGRWIQSFNVAPTSQVPMLRRNQQGELELLAARWGLIPNWWKQPNLPDFSFNARSEEAATKPMWRQSLRTHRCVMPMQGWYEWNEHQYVRNRTGRKVNQPYYLYAPDEGVLAVAGLWASWIDQEGQQVISCALLTKAAAPSVSFVHHRMPVILAPEQFDLWLAPNSRSEQVQNVIALSQADFAARPVSTDVGNVSNDYPELLEPVEVLEVG
ncbi:SOS response-associated peptidase [Pseudomonas aeruginosa]|nr:SOS response-associated peptidase [Pseudomonas aeruginosa]MCT5519303.1 SOS response-associated peptidase [Pseudomonas aeruginosa]MEE2515659.1 SOS response-associated peptidase [Pseudomonas aeruginosa]HEJ1327439.1 SOS response-associated peptidase [Pseudomonas aeruginosa]